MPRAPALLLAGLLLAPLLAGCLAPGSDVETGAPPGPRFGALRCDERASGPVCNFRVTLANGPANEVSLAVNPVDPGNMVAGAKDYTLGEDRNCGRLNVWAGQYWSRDGGRTWGNRLLDGNPGQEPPVGPLAGYACVTDPVLAFDREGVAYYSGLAYNRDLSGASPATLAGAKGSNVFLAKSRDGGETFDEWSIVAEGDGQAVFHDKQWFAIDPADPDRIYFTWSAFLLLPDAPGVPDPLPRDVTGYHDVIMFSKTEDGGRSWSPMRAIADLGRQQVSTQFSMPVVTPDGVVHVTFVDFRTSEIQYVRSTDGGETFSSPRAIQTVAPLPGKLANTEFRVSTYPVLAADPTSGALYVVWADYGRGNADVLLLRSVDGGTTWSGPVRLNDDRGEGDQFMPWISVGPEGDVHAAWYDRRDDPENRLVTVYYAHSRDGSDWDTNLRVGDVLFDGDDGVHQSGSPYLGDYISVVAGADAAHVLWADARHGRTDAYYAEVGR